LRFFSIILILFYPYFLIAQNFSDSLITLKKSKFFTDLAEKKGGISSLQVEGRAQYLQMSPYLKEYPVEYLPTPEGLFLHLGRSGRIYRMEDRGDSLLYFVRLDRTVNYNYNIGSFLFYSHGEILEIGGYGFWKSNGLLRRYNPKDKEWDIVPTNREVHVPIAASWRQGAWVDPNGDHVYVPYEQIVNDGLISGSEFSQHNSTDFYRLETKGKVWEKLGVTTDKAFEIIRASNWTCFPSDRGLYLGFTKGIYHFDFLSNQISFNPDPGFVQSLMRIQSSQHCYYHRGWIYAFNPTTYQYDSMCFDTKNFVLTKDRIWKKPFPYVAAGFGLFALVVVGGLLAFRFAKRKRALPSPSLVGVAAAPRPFTEVEQALLSLLLNRSENGQTANIGDINYVLGIKDKSPGMQKKVRSDVISSLNEKFAFVTHSKEPLVQSVRSEFDKRYFEYLINADFRDDLKRMLV
jgi:hypothetical protein